MTELILFTILQFIWFDSIYLYLYIKALKLCFTYFSLYFLSFRASSQISRTALSLFLHVLQLDTAHAVNDLSIARPSGLVHCSLLVLPAYSLLCCEQVSCLILFHPCWKLMETFAWLFIICWISTGTNIPCAGSSNGVWIQLSQPLSLLP